MESTRCPRCAALVPAGAPWCGQCYADLRPPTPPEPDPHPDPLTAPLALIEAGLAPLAGPAVATAPARETPGAGSADPADPPVRRPTWPCLRCQHVNDVDDDACRRCGGGFLAGVEQADIALPGIGRARSMERSHKIALIVGGSVALMLFLVGMSIVIGTLV
ncbi:MAG: hypothetical protein ACJ74O_06790 [Frankiaceae bacterium]